MLDVSENSRTQPSRKPLFSALNNLSSQYGLREEQDSVENEALQDGLADFVRKQFNRAADHRRAIGVDSRLVRSLAAIKCEYTAEEKALLDPNTNVYIGIAALKSRAAQSWLRDIILNNIDKPWTIEPTPIPDLPEAAKEQVLDLLVRELTAVDSQLSNIEQIRERAKELKTVALSQAADIAEDAIRKMETLLVDQFSENNFDDTFASLIEDFCSYPAAFVRGPFNSQKKVAKWDGNAYSAHDKVIPDCRVINPWDAYPSPTSTTASNGEFFIETTKLSASAIYNGIGVKGFDEVNIRRALDEYCEGYSLGLPNEHIRENLEEIDQGTMVKSNTIETIIYNGLVPGKFLIEHGALVKDPQKQYEAEIWLAGDYVIKAALNPNILDKRPIYNSSFKKRNRSIWGDSPIDLVYDTMRICNASVRSLVRNMALASGPIGEADSTRIADGSDPTQVEPYKVYLVTPDMMGGGQPAFKFHNIDSIAAELMAVFERFMKIADDLSGIPAYVLGNPSVAGAGRTMGGLSMLMGNAAKGIKDSQLNLDKDIIGPLVEGFYIYNMITSDDTAVKADAKVIARGATGLLQRELAQARMVEVLGIITPYMQNWDNLPDGIKIILREVLKQTGLPVDDILPDPKKRDALLAKLRELGQAEAFSRGTSTPEPLPPQSQPPGGIDPLSGINPRPMPLAMPGGA